MVGRLRAFLREIGGRLRALLDEVGPRNTLTAAIALLALCFLALSLSLVWLAVTWSRQQATEQIEGAREEEPPPVVQPEDFPLIFGPGPSGGPSEATSPDGRRLGIPGLSSMDVIGELQYVPGTAFRCPGGSRKRTCRSSAEGNPAVYEVTVVQDDPKTVLSVVATASDAPEEEAARVLGRVAELSLKDASPMDVESWVRRGISSGGQYFADGAEVRLYGTERSRTLEIVASAPPAAPVPEITVQGFEATQTTTPGSR